MISYPGNKQRVILTLFFLSVISFFTGCKEDYTPKPHGYFRIDFPEKSYTQYDENSPFVFEYPFYGAITKDLSKFAEPYWINVVIPANKAQIHLSYKKVNGNLEQLINDSHVLAYKHSQKADAIIEKLYINTKSKVYGTIFEITGNAASPMQFHLTDSTKNFIRGSFYISEIPNYDSLSPVIHFIEEDIYHLIETLNWN